MTFIYRLVTLVAALIIILLTLNVLAVKYEIGPSFDFWSVEQDDDYSEFYESGTTEDAGVPTTATGRVSIPTAEIERDFRRHFERTEWHVFPVVYNDGRRRKVFENYFSSSGVRYEDNREPLEFYEGGGDCSLNVVNFLAVNSQTDEVITAFGERLFAPNYFYHNEAGKQTLAAIVIDSDTNGNGNYDCGDNAEFRLIGLNHAMDHKIDLQVNPASIFSFQYIMDDRFYLISERVGDTGEQSVKNTVINRDTLDVNEKIIGDFVSDAQAAFENVTVN